MILSMKGSEMVNRILDIQYEFVFHGFLVPPVSGRRIASWIIRGFSDDEIYAMGCDVAAGYSNP